MWFLGQVSVAKFIVAFFLLLPPLILCHSTWVFFACCLLKRPSLSSYADYDQIPTPFTTSFQQTHSQQNNGNRPASTIILFYCEGQTQVPELQERHFYDLDILTSLPKGLFNNPLFINCQLQEGSGLEGATQIQLHFVVGRKPCHF